jgi:hypothetical protein
MFTIIKIEVTTLAIGGSPRIPLNAYATESSKPPLHDGCSDVPDIYAARDVGDFFAEYIGDV